MSGSRREFLGRVAAGLVLGARKSGGEPAGAGTGAGATDPLVLDGPQLLAALQSGELSAEALARSALRRLQECGDLNIVTWKSEPAVMEAARAVDRRRVRGERLAPLAGVPILVKDNINTVGFATTAGTQGLKGYRPALDATVVSRLRAQGALVLAKTNMHELACGSTSSNAFFGPVRNPYARNRITGGSSGGTAAGLAARASVVGLGSDSAGSARIPAALCGVAGFRPSFGPGYRRYPSDGIVPLARALDTCGPMGRTVADVIVLDEAITGRPVRAGVQLRGARLGVSRADHWSKLDPEVARVGERGLALLREAGAELVEVDLRPVWKHAEDAFWTLLLAGMQTDIADFLKRDVPGVSLERLIAGIRSVDVREVFDKNLRERVEPAALEAAKVEQRRAQVRYGELFQRYRLDAVIFPTVPMLAPTIRPDGDRLDDTVMVGGEAVAAGMAGIRHTVAACALGAPGLSIPAGLSAEGLPVGLEIDGISGADERVLALGRQIELVWGPLAAPGGRDRAGAHPAGREG
jgi:indoleacetamide hydrolase